MEITLLGTGNCAQVPVYGCRCPACEKARNNPNLQRKACSALLNYNNEHILIDSGLTDLAERFPPGSLSAIIQTHYHADHAQGLLHLRWGMDQTIPVYGPSDPEGFADLFKHPGILDFQPHLQAGTVFELGQITVTSLALQHSRPTLGYVFSVNNQHIAYLTDTAGFPEKTLEMLQLISPQILIIDCSFPPQKQKNNNHNTIEDILEISTLFYTNRIIITHIGHQLDEWLYYNKERLPINIRIGYDGMKICEK